MSTGHGEKLTRKQEDAIAALLSADTVEAAATAAGVAYSTLRRWLHDDAFRAAFRAARLEVVEAAIARLQQSTADAVEALRRNLTCGKPGDEVRAALGLIDRAFRGAELLDLAERVEALEARQGDGDEERGRGAA